MISDADATAVAYAVATYVRLYEAYGHERKGLLACVDDALHRADRADVGSRFRAAMVVVSREIGVDLGPGDSLLDDERRHGCGDAFERALNGEHVAGWTDLCRCLVAVGRAGRAPCSPTPT